MIFVTATVSPIWPKDGALTCTTTVNQSGPRNNGNEGVLHTPKISRNGALPSDTVLCHSQDTPFEEMGVLPLCREVSQHILSLAY